MQDQSLASNTGTQTGSVISLLKRQDIFQSASKGSWEFAPQGYNFVTKGCRWSVGLGLVKGEGGVLTQEVAAKWRAPGRVWLSLEVVAEGGFGALHRGLIMG